MKKYYRCYVCGDIHFGVKAPEVCPTCLVKNAYIEISSDEAERTMRPTKTIMTKPEFRRAIAKFTEKNEFEVNPDEAKVDMLLDGVAENERNHGLKYCPCRLRTKVFNEDLKLVCPCNFIIHETYKGKEDGECWCGLFIRRKK
jgi:ferredoxin-thioredoxin reductase catalytic subunit